MAKTRAKSSQRAGTETAGREHHVVDWRRERGDALRRGSHEEPLRRDLGRRSRKSASSAQSLKCFVVNRFSQRCRPASELANRDRDYRRHLDPTTMRGPLEQEVETLRFGAAVDYRARIRAVGRSTRQTHALRRCRYRGHPTVFSARRRRCDTCCGCDAPSVVTSGGHADD